MSGQGGGPRVKLFDDEPAKPVRSGADWENHRRHRYPQSGPPQDEIGALALSSFLLARSSEVVIAVRGITAYSDGLHLAVVVVFADEQKSDELAYSLTDYSRSPGRFRFGCVYADGSTATSGTRDAPTVEATDTGPSLVLLRSSGTGLLWNGEYWLHPLPPPGPFVLGCRWPDRGIPESLVEIDPTPLLEAAAKSAPVWGPSPGRLRL